MSNTRGRSLTRAGGIFLLWFILLAVIWAVAVEPYYDIVIVRVSEALLHEVESQPMTGSIHLDGFHAIVSHRGEASGIEDQRLELRTHENNTPFLFALILATPWLTWKKRLQVAALAGALLWLTHVFHLVLCVHWLYAWENAGPYRVTDMSYLDKGFWQSLDNSAQAKKYLLNYTYHFYTHVGRLLAPIFLWMLFAARRQERGGRRR